MDKEKVYLYYVGLPFQYKWKLSIHIFMVDHRSARLPHSLCLRSYYSLKGPRCLSHLYKLIDCMRINCNFYYDIVRNKWFKWLNVSLANTRLPNLVLNDLAGSKMPIKSI